ncbi:Apc4 domain-containing protein [Rhizoctonia solani AG-1 IA]|uniref:Apc4 domain-containing protein n=1 Tax=Thanatephorus cucumeris (strain AG1-IA) TaxID=983506 RepID=L8WXY5_THACA|nr:Apc4 domain-containing protein [Rhizoctonia solani AG-1 IA]
MVSSNEWVHHWSCPGHITRLFYLRVYLKLPSVVCIADPTFVLFFLSYPLRLDIYTPTRRDYAQRQPPGRIAQHATFVWIPPGRTIWTFYTQQPPISRLDSTHMPSRGLDMYMHERFSGHPPALTRPRYSLLILFLCAQTYPYARTNPATRAPDRYAQFRFSQEVIERCLSHAHRLVAYVQWLAIEANAELARFVEFIKFMRSEIQKVIEPDLNARPPGQTQVQYDTLEAMAYIEQGLLESALTAWFTGLGPRTYPGELSHATPPTMREAIEQARRALDGKDDATVCLFLCDVVLVQGGTET